MTPISATSTSYIIPLEGIELSYLNKYVRNPQGNTVPLWSTKKLDGEAEYFHVRIVADDGKDDSYIEPAKTYKCHICNDNIPIRYFKIHNQSNKHETLKNIYQTVLERVTKQMNSSLISDDENNDQNLYYCEACCKMIKIENKIFHENSSYHKKSEENMTVINNFYDYFTTINIEKKSDLNEHENDESETECNISETDERCSSSDELNDSSIYSSNVSKNPTLVTKTSENDELIISEVDEFKETRTEDPDNDFQKYLKEISQKYKVQVPEMDDKMIILEVIETGNQIRVTPEKFQSLRCLGRNYYCQMCQIWVRGTELHSYTEGHVKNIMKPLNADFGRQVSKFTSHCIPCNEVVVTGSKLHLDSEQHLESTRSMFSFTEYHRGYPDDVLFCTICNISVEKSYELHSKTKNHIKNLIEENQMYILDNEEVICEICTVKTTVSDLKFHVSSKNHVKNKKKVYKVSVPKVKGNNQCEICQVRVPKRCMKFHIPSDRHQAKMEELCTVDEPKKITILKRPVEPKNVEEEISPKNIVEESPKIVPKDDHPAVNNNNDFDDEITDKDEEFYYSQVEYIDPFKMEVRCKTCLVILPSCYRNIVEHVQGKKHAEYVELYKEKAAEFKDLLSFKDNKVKCIICDMTLNYNDRNVVKHMKSVAHVKRIEDKKMADDMQEKAGEIQSSSDENEFGVKNCDLCKIAINSKNFDLHKNGKKHQSIENDLFQYHGISRVGSKFHCYYCQVNVEKKYLAHINSEKHTLAFQYKHPIDTTVLTTYGRDDKFTDPIAYRYKRLYENLLKYNNIKKTSDLYFYCNICNSYVDVNNEIVHIYEKKHKLLLQGVKNMVF
nr:uncharacterized protein LOC126054343 isoform X1 [Helicoverpa armigera]